jgi:hypothetical protein
MIDRAIGIAGLALSIIFGLALYGWPKMPQWLAQIGVGLGLVLIGLAVGLVIGDRRSATELGLFAKWPRPYSPELVSGKTFRNERVILDAHSYSRCTFENITFVYNGTTPIQLNNNTFSGTRRFASDNQSVTGAWLLFIGMGVTIPGITLEDVPSSSKIETPRPG